MDVPWITVKELQQFRDDLLIEIKNILNKDDVSLGNRWLRTRDVCRLLKISPSSVQNLRQSGALPFTKLSEEGTIFYKLEDIEAVLEKTQPGFHSRVLKIKKATCWLVTFL